MGSTLHGDDRLESFYVIYYRESSDPLCQALRARVEIIILYSISIRMISFRLPVKICTTLPLFYISSGASHLGYPRLTREGRIAHGRFLNKYECLIGLLGYQVDQVAAILTDALLGVEFRILGGF